MRDWCVVADAVSLRAADHLGRMLVTAGFDVDVQSSQARVWCFGDDEHQAREIKERMLELIDGEPLLQIDPMIRAWNEERHMYVDPEAPDLDPDTEEIWIDSDLEPGEITWRVRLALASVFEFRRVRPQLPQLRRPVIAEGNSTIDLGARDRNDAEAVAARAAALKGVVSADPTEIRGRLQRWLVRQHLAGNYSVSVDGSGPGYDYGGFLGDGGWGGDGGGGHGGH
jgi:hypothetical protein